MANRRMIAKDVVTGGEFIEMSLPAQALYFQLNLQADDDGFVDCLMIRRMLGVGDDVLEELTESGFLVKIPNAKKKNLYHIRHWRKHNSIDTTKYKKSDYFSTLQDLYPDYEDYQSVLPKWLRDKKSDGNEKFPKSSQENPDAVTQVRLGQDSVGQSSVGQSRVAQGSSEKGSLGQLSQGQRQGQGQGSPDSCHGDDVDVDDDDDVRFNSVDEYIAKYYPMRIRDYIKEQYGYNGSTVGEIAKYLKKVDTTVVIWAAMKAAYNANSHRSYFNSVLDDKIECKCTTFSDICDAEDDDLFELFDMNKAATDIRDKLAAEYKEQFEDGQAEQRFSIVS